MDFAGKPDQAGRIQVAIPSAFEIDILFSEFQPHPMINTRVYTLIGTDNVPCIRSTT